MGVLAFICFVFIVVVIIINNFGLDSLDQFLRSFFKRLFIVFPRNRRLRERTLRCFVCRTISSGCQSAAVHRWSSKTSKTRSTRFWLFGTSSCRARFLRTWARPAWTSVLCSCLRLRRCCLRESSCTGGGLCGLWRCLSAIGRSLKVLSALLPLDRITPAAPLDHEPSTFSTQIKRWFLFCWEGSI